MFGALYGDIIGSYYENYCTKDYNFEFQKDSHFTDDTVLTIATSKAILNNSKPIKWYQLKSRAKEYAYLFKQYYSYYPNAGFGSMFSSWAKDTGLKINRSYGNGAAMRVVPIGYAYNSIKQIKLQVIASCMYTHRNREAIISAQAVAIAVFLARKGYTKDELREYIQKHFRYNLTTNITEFREKHVFNPKSSYSVPAAIIAFLESSDYESAIRNAISLGGDADTEACIAGGIAQAYYKEIPKHISDFCDGKIDYSLRKVANEFVDKFSE